MKKTLRKQIISLSFIGILLISCTSCKKNESTLMTAETPNSEVGKIRSWVESQPGFVNFQKVPEGANSVEVRKIIEWGKAKYFAKSKTYVIPVQVGFGNSMKAEYRYLITSLDGSGNVKNASYVDVLTKDRKINTPEELVISPDLVNLSSIPSGFTGSIIKYDIDNKLVSSSHFKQGVLEEGKSDMLLLKLNKNDENGGTNNYEGENCFIIDHWWVTYIDYVIVAIEYEGSTQMCSGGHTGGGGGGNNGPSSEEVADAAIANVLNSASATSVQLSSVTQQKVPELRVRLYTWKCLQTMGWYLVSHEKGVHKKVNGVWVWESLENQGVSSNGMAVGVTLNASLNYANATVGVYNATMNLGINLAVSVTVLGIPITHNRDFSTAITYNINDPGNPGY
ncbi:MAG: hypothetical protein IPL84_01160 [Chitinophagaceae bacterium]|nr:hypothetical protein [Chitinophagaceae bacterium]